MSHSRLTFLSVSTALKKKNEFNSMFKGLKIFKKFEMLKMFNKPLSQDLQHLSPSALTPAAWPLPSPSVLDVLSSCGRRAFDGLKTPVDSFVGFLLF